MSSLYVTAEELANAPIGVNWATLMPGTQAAQLQAWYAQQVSSHIDNYVGKEVYGPTRPYVLKATTDTEAATTDSKRQAFIDEYGNLCFIVRYRPIISVSSAQFWTVAGSGMKPAPGAASTLDPTTMYFEDDTIVWLGPFTLWQYTPLRVQVTYVDGFANAILTANAASGATTLAVDDLTGFQPGQQVNAYDMPPEVLTVSPTYTPATGAGSLPIVGGLAGAHASGIRVSALDPVLQEAAILLVQHLVQTKVLVGAQAAWQTLGERSVVKGMNDYIGMAYEILDNYKLFPGI